MIDTDSILHPTPFCEGTSEVLTKALESWDLVRGNFPLIEQTLGKIVNKVVRKQNEIHTRIEQRRPWENCEYRVKKFEYLSTHFKVKISPNRDVITGEVPVETISIPKELVLGAHNPETFEKFFSEYESRIHDKHILEKTNRELVAAEMLRQDFEAAKDFYFKYKEHFDQVIAEVQKNMLSYEDWEKKYYTRTISEDDKQDFQALHNISLDDEIEKIKRQEYDLYVQRVYIGLE